MASAAACGFRAGWARRSADGARASREDRPSREVRRSRTSRSIRSLGSTVGICSGLATAPPPGTPVVVAPFIASPRRLSTLRSHPDDLDGHLGELTVAAPGRSRDGASREHESRRARGLPIVWYGRARESPAAPVGDRFAAAVAVWLAAPPAQAAESPQEQLVRTYSPIVMLRAQEDPPCDTAEEQYEPTTVNVVLGNPRVNLARPAEAGQPEIVRPAPTAADIAGLGGRLAPRHPGRSAEPGVHLRQGLRGAEGGRRRPRRSPTPTSRRQRGPLRARRPVLVLLLLQPVQRHPRGRLGGHADRLRREHPPRGARHRARPRSRSSSTGAARRGAGTTTRSRRRGPTRSSIPAAGSHATFFDSAVYVENGQGGSGLGCDNTTEPLRRVAPRPVLVPTDPPPGTAAFEWLTYEGHWGEKEKSYNNGPTGPNTKTAVAGAVHLDGRGARRRARSSRAGSSSGPAVTQAFCGAVATVSSLVNLEAKTRLGAILIGVVLVLLVAVPIGLTRWTPGGPRPAAAATRLRPAGAGGPAALRASLADLRRDGPDDDS